MVAPAKKEPGKLAAGTPPAPTINYFAAELFNMMAGVDITVVMYKGTAALTNDLLGGHVPFGFNTISPSISNIEAGKLRALAVAAPMRTATLPNVATAAESGYLDLTPYNTTDSRRRRARRARLSRGLTRSCVSSLHILTYPYILTSLHP